MGRAPKGRPTNDCLSYTNCENLGRAFAETRHKLIDQRSEATLEVQCWFLQLNSKTSPPVISVKEMIGGEIS